MSRRVEVRSGPSSPSNVSYEESTTINGRHVTRGQELSIARFPGRVRFLQAVTHRNGNRWLNVVDRRGALRSFDPARVETVHRINRTRENNDA